MQTESPYFPFNSTLLHHPLLHSFYPSQTFPEAPPWPQRVAAPRRSSSSSMVVASTPEAARAFLKTLDINFSNRPPNAGATLLAYHAQDMALEDWSQVRAVELGHMLRAMLEWSQREEPVVVPEIRRVFETKGSESNEFKDMVVELMTSAGYFNIGDFIPSIAWLDIQGIQRGMKHLHRKFDCGRNPDFLDVIMANQENSTGRSSLLPTLKHSSCCMAQENYVENPSILKRAHEEMDQVIGRSRRLVESDLPKLPYIQAICKESFRKHPSTPLNLPRVSTQACEVNGYYIPKNTRLRTLVHSFDWKMPDGVEINMDEAGLALQKAVSLSAMVTPRLHQSAYAV
ncbi:hypothetical protein AAG906_037975 [Vitis piasezkii]